MSESPESGKLGWIALHTGLVDPEELEASLRQQAEQAAADAPAQLGEVLRARGRVQPVQLRRLVSLQQAWRFACGALALDRATADRLANRLTAEGRFDLQTLFIFRQPEALAADAQLVSLLDEMGVALPRAGEGGAAPAGAAGLSAPTPRRRPAIGRPTPARPVSAPDPAPAPDPEVADLAAGDVTPRVGQLGWIALRARLILPVELDRALRLQYGRAARPDTQKTQLGQLLVDRDLLEPDQLSYLLELQRAWSELEAVYQPGEQQAEALAFLLAQRGWFDPDTLRACARGGAALPADLRELLQLVGVAPA